MRFNWKAVLGIVVSVFLLWWVFRGEDIDVIAAEVASADPWLLLASITVATTGFLIRAMRWKILLHPLHPNTSLASRFKAVCIGFGANNVLPMRAGEFARVFFISKMEPVTVSGALGSTVVERLLDAIVIFSLLFVALLHPSFPAGVTIAGRPIATAVQGIVVMLALMIVGFAFLLIWPRRVVQLGERVAGVLPERMSSKIVVVLESFLEGLEVLRSPKLLTLALLWSFGFWLWHAWSFWLGFKAFGIDLGYEAALFCNAVVALFVAVPSSPGFFGTFHAGAKIALADVYGVSQGSTLAFAFGYHLGGFIPVTLMGFYFAWQLGFSLKDVGSSRELVEEEIEHSHEGAPS